MNIVEQAIGYEFVNQNLLQTALTHRSYREVVNGKKVQASNYERLEFLGDAVLELVITEYLYTHFDKNEGELTAIRSQLVNRHILASLGSQLGLEDAIRISEHEKAEVGHARESIVADCVEAILGAVYVEAGYPSVQQIILSLLIPEVNKLIAQESVKDPKTELQEKVQQLYKITPSYKTIESRGKDHQKEFLCALTLKNTEVSQAWGKSKQEAQTQAAHLALIMLSDGTMSEILGAPHHPTPNH